jgi:hypothetical protein
LIKEGWAENKEEYESISRKLNVRANKRDQFMIAQLYQNCYVEKEWCSDNYHVCVAYEFFERTLDQELADRRQKDGKLPFRERVFILFTERANNPSRPKEKSHITFPQDIEWSMGN